MKKFVAFNFAGLAALALAAPGYATRRLAMDLVGDNEDAAVFNAIMVIECGRQQRLVCAGNPRVR
jgi:hypothetical protein